MSTVEISLLREVCEQLVAASEQLKKQYEDINDLEKMCVATCIFNETIRPRRREQNLRLARGCDALVKRLHKEIGITSIEE